jgi:hypothetical protein
MSSSREDDVRRSTLLTLAGFAALVALMLYLTLAGGRTSCEVCITFDGRTQCGRAEAPTEAEAINSARTVACATLASGRAESLACGRMEPIRSSCDAR